MPSSISLPLALRSFRLRFRQVGERTRRRVTREGVFVLAGYIVALFFVVNTRSNMNFQIFALLLSLFAVANVACLFVRLRGFAARRTLPPYAAAGEPLAYELQVQNKGQTPQDDLLVFENVASEAGPGLWGIVCAERGGIEAREFALGRLEAGEARSVRVVVVPRRRGVLRFTGVSVGAPDPLGLFRALAWVEAAGRVLVLPQRYAVGAVNLAGGRRFQPGGVRLAASVGDGGDFFALREYRQGDPLRHIHWRSWARLGRPIVKEFQDEFFVRHALLLDTFLDAVGVDADAYERFEEAVSVAASFAVAERPQDALLDLLFVAGEVHLVTAGRGVGRADQMLEALAEVEPRFEGDFGLLRDSALKHASAVSGCICVFLAWDTTRQNLVTDLRERGIDVLALCVLNANDDEPSPGALADRPERFRVLRCGSIAEGLASL